MPEDTFLKKKRKEEKGIKKAEVKGKAEILKAQLLAIVEASSVKL